MSRRVTLMVNIVLDRKIKNRQAKLIKGDLKSHSYSQVFNNILRKALKTKTLANGNDAEFHKTSRRVTVMIDDDLDEKTMVQFGEKIIQCAKNHCKMPSWSFSKEINRLLQKGFEVR